MPVSDEQQITQIEDKIAGLRRQICDLQHSRNSFLPISRLPPELLCRVFIFIRDSVPESVNDRKTVPPWVKLVTHVCRHWRGLAYNCPQLWSTLNFDITPPLWIGLQLQWSKNAPLSVSATLGAPQENGLLDALSQPHRLRTLNLKGYIYQEGLSKYFGKLYDVSAPKLENLILHLRTHNENEQRPPFLPTRLFQGGTPVLRNLELRGLLIPFISPVFNNLTSIKLESVNTSSPVNPGAFFDALAQCPGLKVLDISVNFPGEVVNINRSQAVLLKDLESLHIRTCILKCASIIKQLAFPLSATVEIAATDDIIDDVFRHEHAQSDAKALASALDVAWLSNPLSGVSADHSLSMGYPRHLIRSFRLTFGYAGRLVLEMGFQNRDFGELSAECVLPGCPLRIKVQGNFNIIKHFISDPLVMDQLDSAVISGYSHQSMWPCLRSLPNLRSVYVHKGETYSFIQCIMDDPVMHLSVDDCPPTGLNMTSTLPPLTHFANVTNIAFDHGNFGAALYDRPLQQRDKPIDFDTFLLVLKLRHNRQAPIHHLRFHKCINLFGHHINKIKEYVSDVSWDQHEEGQDDRHLRRSVFYDE